MPTISLLSQLDRTQRFTRGVPDRFTITEDGATVLFLRGRSGEDPVTCLWALDLDSGTERVIADPAVLLDTEPAAGIEAYSTDAAARRVAFVVGDGLWTVDVHDADPRRLPTPDQPVDPRLDPAGTRIAYRHGDELRCIDVAGTDDQALATPDGPDITFGYASLTGETALDYLVPRGFWWAPDGERLLVARSDVTQVQLWHLSDPTHPTQPARSYRHPAVGTHNPDVTLWFVDLDGSRTQVDWDRAAFEYVVGAGWDTHGPYTVVQSRDQRVLRFLVIDPATGQTSVLHEQRDEHWVQLLPGLPTRTSSGALVTAVDDGDTRHLAIGGTVCTPPGLNVRGVLDVSGEDVLFVASDDPTLAHLYRHTPTDGLQRLTDDDAVHDGIRRGRTLVRITKGPGLPGGSSVVLRESHPPVPITSLVAEPVLELNARRLVLGPRELRADLYLPSWHDQDHGRLPILLDPYGGAALARVTAEVDARRLRSQWFAEQGFAVLVADGAGTPGRGPAWEREVHGDLFGPALADQIAALAAATRLFPQLDTSRVGIRGWSFSGSLTEFAILTRPDIFHAAAAGAGVTDQTLYNTHWRERFLGLPTEFPDAYERDNLLRLAPRLTRPLLLIHGLDDDNVHPANTLLLSQALLAAGRPHELLLLPGIGHAMSGPTAEQVLRHQLAFFRRHL